LDLRDPEIYFYNQNAICWPFLTRICVLPIRNDGHISGERFAYHFSVADRSANHAAGNASTLTAIITAVLGITVPPGALVPRQSRPLELLLMDDVLCLLTLKYVAAQIGLPELPASFDKPDADGVDLPVDRWPESMTGS
jgi:hypothetical protein